MAPPVRSLEERFWENVQVKDGCWEWLASKGHYGHGQTSEVVEGKRYNRLAHRVSWKIHHGYYPEGNVNHHCDNPGCVNPSHLYEGTQLENMRDRESRGRNPATNKQYCKNGHDDWSVRGKYRRCAECHRQDTRRRANVLRGASTSSS